MPLLKPLNHNVNITLEECADTLEELTAQAEAAAAEAWERIVAGNPMTAEELRERGIWSNGRGGKPGIPAWEDDFIKNYSETGILWVACRATGVERTTVYRHRRWDLRFSLRMQQAKEQAKEILEAECRRRALAGSDLLMIFTLKRLDPAYRDAQQRTMTVVGDPEHPLEVRHQVEAEEFEKRAFNVIQRLAALPASEPEPEEEAVAPGALVLEGHVEGQEG